MKTILSFAIVVICTISPVLSESPSKAGTTWTSSDGRTIHATMLRLEGENVILQKDDGGVFSVPLTKLSAESQAAARAGEPEAKSNPKPKTDADTKPDTTATSPLTVDTARKGIIGVWNGVWQENDAKISYVISFDAQGRITEKGFVAAMGVLGSAGPRQGKVTYKLEANKDGAGVVIVETAEDAKQTPIYIIQEITEKTAKMCAIDSQTLKTKASVSWKRIRTDPYPIDPPK